MYVCAHWGARVEVDWREQAAEGVTLGMGHCCSSVRCAGGSDHMLLTIGAYPDFAEKFELSGKLSNWSKNW